MSILDIIQKKQNKQELTKQEIEYFVTEYTNGNIADYQASALIMAIYINGMTDREITNLTLAMAYSGEVLNLSSLGIVVDKHSTGGVGDKITLILMPIVSALGVPVAKMSGRGLGFTGGTVDKLESIPGYKTQISVEEFINNVKKIGISLIGQSLNLAPADKKIYALRDSISCVNSIPLIASSIMSKKIASGANKIVLDVTCGNGAFMKTRGDAEKLAEKMIAIGKIANKETECVITYMDQPLGYSIGNSLEVIEAIEALKGNIKEDVKEVVLSLGAEMLKLAGKGEDISKNKESIEEVIKNGKAFEKFKQLVENQGGDVSYIENTKKFKNAEYIIPIYAPENKLKNTNANVMKKVVKLSAEVIGRASCIAGAGREKKEDSIDMSAGIILNKKVGDHVKLGDILAYLHTNKKEKIEEIKELILNAYEIQ